MIQKIIPNKYCPDGKIHNVIDDEDAGEILCNHCGIVFEERTIFDEMKSHTYTLDASQTKSIGQSSKYIGTSTMMKSNMTDCNGRKTKTNTLFRHINKWDNRIRSDSNKTKVLLGITQSCEILGLNDIQQLEVEKYMKKIIGEKLTKGRETRDLIAATIYYVCKKFDIPKTMAEIGTEMNIPTKRIYKNLRVINDAYGTVNKVQNLESYVSQYFTKTNLPPKYEKDVLKYLKVLQKQNFHEGKSPSVLIGAIMKYILLNSYDVENVTFSSIAKACDISDVSLRNMCDRVSSILQYGVE